MGRIKKLLTVLAVGSGVVCSAAPAYAAPDGSVSPNTNLHDGDTLVVSLTGWLPEPSSFTLSLIQCKPGSVDIGTCEPTLTEETIFFDGDGSGNATLADFTVETIPGVCDSANPCALYAIENPSNFGTTAPNRAVELDTLEFAAGTEPVVPEVPLNLLLPLGGAAVLGIGTVTIRRRNALAAA